MSVPSCLIVMTPHWSTRLSEGRLRAVFCRFPLQFRVASERIPQFPTESLDVRIESDALWRDWVRPYTRSYRAQGQRKSDVVGKGSDHLVGLVARSFVTQDPDPAVLPEALVEIELVASPPEERGRVEWGKPPVQQGGDRLPRFLGHTHVSPVQRVPGTNRLQIPVRVVRTESTHIGPRDLRVMTKHPDGLHRVGGIHECSG